MCYERMIWIYVTRKQNGDGLLNMIMIRLYLSNSGNFLSRSKTVNFTRRIVFHHVVICGNSAGLFRSTYNVLWTQQCIAWLGGEYSVPYLLCASPFSDARMPLPSRWFWLTAVRKVALDLWLAVQVVPLFTASCNVTQHNTIRHVCGLFPFVFHPHKVSSRLIFLINSLSLELVVSVTKNFCVLHIQSNTTIFHLVVQ